MKTAICLVMSSLVSSAVLAEMDGSRVLQEEARRAQEVQELQYQAELLKQRAEIVKYMNEIKKNGGDVSDLGFGMGNEASAPTPAPQPASYSKPASGELPTLLQIQNGRAQFNTSEGKVSGSPGQVLPGGYRIVSLNARNGVRLQKDGVNYDIDIEW